MTRLRVAIGPENSTFGSWNWVGKSLLTGLSHDFETFSFRESESLPAADITIFVKFLPEASRLLQIRSLSRLVFMPIDIYGSAAEIDSDSDRLKQMDLTLVHSTRLERYLTPYTATEYVDHPLGFALPKPREWVSDGPLLWIGRRCNIGPVVEWFNLQRPENELWVLTNREDEGLNSAGLGFAAPHRVRTETWNETRHLDWLTVARAAIDIKGLDFRSRHKPAAKLLDYLASGVPCIANRLSPSFWFARQRRLLVIDAASWKDDLDRLNPDIVRQQAIRLRDELHPDGVAGFICSLLSDLVARPQKTIRLAQRG